MLAFMPTRLVHTVIDANDSARQAEFWGAALGWEVADEGDGEFAVAPAGYTYPDAHQAAQVDRLVALGATHADIGQGDVPWEVLADPEGSEFCVLSPR
jgi:predicted enzyme related to lactoylglutathione lyase